LLVFPGAQREKTYGTCLNTTEIVGNKRVNQGLITGKDRKS